MKKIFLIALSLLLAISCQSASKEEAYDCVSEYHSDITSSDIYAYRHNRTGLNIIFEENPSGPAYIQIFFRTPMQDEGDLNHVIEHSLLSGSSKYPSSYLLYDITGKSFAYDINANTGYACTSYFMSSPSTEQAEIYLDILFSLIEDPDFTRNENIYRREAVRSELDNPEDEINAQGTVYTEDIGYIDRDSFAITRGMLRTLYPDTAAANMIGRLPLNLEKNTCARVLEIFNEYYNYDNALLYIYGEFDRDKILEFLDREYLSSTERIGTDLSRFYTQGYESKREGEFLIPKTAGYPEGPGTEHIAYCFAIPDFTLEEIMKLDIFSSLLSMNGSIFYQELDKAGITGSAYVTADDSSLFPYFCFVLAYGDCEDADAFKAACDRTIEQVIGKALSDKEIRDYAESQLLMRSLIAENGSIYAENSELYKTAFIREDFPDAVKAYEDAFRTADSDDAAVFSKLGEGALITFLPDPGGFERILNELSESIREKKAAMSDGEIQALIEETSEYREFANQTYSSKDISIDREDVEDKEILYSPVFDGSYVLQPCDTDTGISEIAISFDTSDIANEDRYLLGLYLLLSDSLGTESVPYSQADSTKRRLIPSFSINVDNDEDRWPVVKYIAMIPDKTAEESVRTFIDFIKSPDFLDISAVSMILSQKTEAYNYARTMTGISIIHLVTAMVDPASMYYYDIFDPGFYAFLLEVQDALSDSERAGELHSRIQDIQKDILESSNAVVELTGCAEAIARIKDMDVLSAFPEGSNEKAYALPEFPKKMILINTSGSADMVMGINPSTNDIPGKLYPWLSVFSDRFLLPLRIGGTIYSPISGYFPLSEYAILGIISDRDPELSYRTINEGWAALKDAKLTDDEINAYSLSTIAHYSVRRGNIFETASTRNLMMHADKAKALDLLNGPKDSSAEDAAKAAEAFSKAFQDGYVVLAGPENLVMPLKDEFDAVIDLRNYK